MKKTTLLIAIAMIAFTVNTFGQVTSKGTSTATIIDPLTVTAVNTLAFGEIAAYATAGTVTVAPAASTSAEPVNVQAIGGAVSAASFTVTGAEGKSYEITLPAGDVFLKDQATAEQGPDMKLINFTSSLDGATTPKVGTIGETFYVGGTLEVAAGQKAGNYEGTFDVTVQYK